VRDVTNCDVLIMGGFGKS